MAAAAVEACAGRAWLASSATCANVSGDYVGLRDRW